MREGEPFSITDDRKRGLFSTKRYHLPPKEFKRVATLMYVNLHLAYSHNERCFRHAQINLCALRAHKGLLGTHECEN